MPQNADGRPHFTYYDTDTLLSFAWDGHSQTVEVSEGGYGEPVTDRIPIGTFRQHLRASEHLEAFRTACDRYVEKQMAKD